MGRKSQESANRKSPDLGREAILDAAERLFAERGIDAVSLRTINATAGYSVAALHYHFGTRDGLIRALLARAQPPMLACRDRLIARLRTMADPPLEGIVFSRDCTSIARRGWPASWKTRSGSSCPCCDGRCQNSMRTP